MEFLLLEDTIGETGKVALKTKHLADNPPSSYISTDFAVELVQ